MSVSKSGFRETPKYVLFWGSVFSQWYRSNFTDFNGVKFSSAEQFMFYHKALLFKDYEMAEAIMKTNDPKKQKEFGRKVKNFDNAIWDEHSFDIVTLGSYLKFSSNPEIRKEMLRFRSKKFVEASPVDKIWGIGLHYDDKNAEDPSKWKGSNKLGKALDIALEYIIKDKTNHNLALDYFGAISKKLNNLEAFEGLKVQF